MKGFASATLLIVQMLLYLLAGWQVLGLMSAGAILSLPGSQSPPVGAQMALGINATVTVVAIACAWGLGRLRRRLKPRKVGSLQMKS